VIHITFVGVTFAGLRSLDSRIWERNPVAIPDWQVYKTPMTAIEMRASLHGDGPPAGLSLPLQALWWDAKGDWARAHGLVDELETPQGMAVHAYMHRKNGEASNADYWYARAGRQFHRAAFDEEWAALVEGL